MRIPPRPHLLLPALLLGLAALCLGPAPSLADEHEAGSRAEPGVRVVAHDLEVRFDLGGHRLVARDRMTVEAPASGGRLELDLAPSLAVLAAARGEEDVASPARREDGTFAFEVPGGTSTVTLHYAGEIFDVVEASEALTWVVGDDTSGVIAEEGIFLSGASRWIPETRGRATARYDITTYVPAPLHVVTQGGRPERRVLRAPAEAHGSDRVRPLPEGVAPPEDGDLFHVAHWPSVLPTDGVSLAGGPFVIRSREVEGVEISTYFFERHANDAPLWLDAAEEVVRRYAPILGAYPHPRFDIVENFFQTGYGMPAWTLLGDRVIDYVTAGARRSGGRIPPGYLDHEYVHGWYGNGLFVHYETGNWCEGLTTYLSNYLAVELESDEKALEHRRAVMEKFSIRVHGERDYALRRFRQKVEDADNDVGYGKASLVFHLARTVLGDDAFFETLRTFTAAHVGEVIAWDDWLAAFDAASDLDVTAFLRPYLERPGLPRLRLDVEDVAQGEDGLWEGHVAIVQEGEGEPWPVLPRVRLEGADGLVSEASAVEPVTARRHVVRLRADFEPVRVVYDARYDQPRRIPQEAIPPCLNATLEGEGEGVVVVRGESDALEDLAGRLVREKGLRRAPADFDVDAHAGPAIVLEALAPLPSGSVGLGGPGGQEVGGASTRGFRVGGKTFTGDELALLRSWEQDGHPRTHYTANSTEAAERAGYVPFYGWDTWVVFRHGRPIDRAVERPEATPTRRALAGLGAAARIERDLAVLTGAPLEGRAPGADADRPATRFIAEQLRERVVAAGGEAPPVHRETFPIPRIHRTSSRTIVVAGAGEEHEGTCASAFRPFAFSAATDGPIEVPARAIARLDFDGTEAAALRAAVVEAGADAPLVAVTLGPKAIEAFSPWLDDPDDLTAASVALLNRPGRSGQPRPRPHLPSWILGRRARVGDIPVVDVPVIAIPATTAERLRALAETDATVGLEIAWAPPAQATNLWALLVPPAATDAARPPVVVLSAHYDALGQATDGRYEGADDNASGVAAVLEATRGLGGDAAEAGLGLVVAFFDAEEWGLRGSRQLVETLTARYDVRAVVNVDSVGRATSRPTHVIGLSTHPSLGSPVKDALEAAGLEVGRDIDRFAFPHGSDHWPFHEAGIPAVTVWATDYAIMNTREDTLAGVEPQGVARVAEALRRLVGAGGLRAR